MFSGGCGILRGIMIRGGAEASSSEQKLSHDVLVQEAGRLITGFLDAFKEAPEVAAGLFDGYFSLDPRVRKNLGHKPLEIQRGSYTYKIHFGSDHYKSFNSLDQNLFIIRNKTSSLGQEVLDEEFVGLGSYRVVTFLKGRRHRGTKDYMEEGLVPSRGSHAAIQSVEAVLTDLKNAA